MTDYRTPQVVRFGDELFNFSTGELLDPGTLAAVAEEDATLPQQRKELFDEGRNVAQFMNAKNQILWMYSWLPAGQPKK